MKVYYTDVIKACVSTSPLLPVHTLCCSNTNLRLLSNSSSLPCHRHTLHLLRQFFTCDLCFMSFPTMSCSQCRSVYLDHTVLHAGFLLWWSCQHFLISEFASVLLDAEFHSLATRGRQRQGERTACEPLDKLVRLPIHNAGDIIRAGTEGARRTNVLKCITSFHR